MSKDSKFRSRIDNDFECVSPRSSRSSSETGKCRISSHSCNSEDAKAAPRNNNTFVHQVLTSNSNSHSNIANETVTNDKSYNTSRITSCSSLEEDLYGTSETFNKNLKSIQKKLKDLQLISRERSSYKQPSPKENCEELSPNSESLSSDKPRGYLSSRDAFHNLDDFSVNEKYASSFNNSDASSSCMSNSSSVSPEEDEITDSPYRRDMQIDLEEFSEDEKYRSNLCYYTGYRTNYFNSSILPVCELEVIEEVDEPDSSSITYQVPQKKLCLRDYTPRIENSEISHLSSEDTRIENSEVSHPSADDIKTLYLPLHKIASASTSTTTLLQFSTCKTEMGKKSTSESDGSSFKKCEYVNDVIQDDEQFNAVGSNRMDAQEKTPAETSSLSSLSAHSKSDSIVNRNFCKVIERMERDNFRKALEEKKEEETLDLHLNLPSSIADSSSDCTKSPIEPRVIVLKKFENKARKKLCVNKVSPQLESEGSTNYWSSGSSSLSSINEMTLLYQKYYENTPSVSSRKSSSPSCMISPFSNFSPSVKSKSETKHKTKLSQRSYATRTSPKNNFTIHKFIDPPLIASLDVPMIGQQDCNFPSITKITTSPEKFNHRGCIGDSNIESDKSESEKGDGVFKEVQVQYTCYTDTAKLLIDSPTISPVRRSHQKHHCPDCGDRPSPDRETPRCHHTSEGSIRKVQSTQLSFYNVSCEYDSSENIHQKRTVINTPHRTARCDDSSAKRKCNKYCCFIFFSKRNRKFF